MTRRVFFTIAALVVLLHAGSTAAYAQRISVDIAFPFVANGAVLPAGNYSVQVSPQGPVTLVGPDRKTILLPVVALLGRHDRDADHEFVFDKMGGKFELSEIWPAGSDGILVLATRTPHEHAVLGGSNPRK